MIFTLLRTQSFNRPCRNLREAEQISCSSLKKILVENDTYLLNKSIWFQANLIANGFCNGAIRHILRQRKEDIEKYIDEHPVFKKDNDIYEFKKKIEKLSYDDNLSVLMATGNPFIFYRRVKECINKGSILMTRSLIRTITYNFTQNKIFLRDVARALVAYSVEYSEYLKDKAERKKLEKANELKRDEINMIERSIEFDSRTVESIKVRDIEINMEELL